MEEKTQGGVGEFPNTPSNFQKALQASQKCFSIVQNEKSPKPSRETCLNIHFRHINIVTAWRHLSKIVKQATPGSHRLAAFLHRQAPLATA